MNVVYILKAFTTIVHVVLEVRKRVEGLGPTDPLLNCAGMFVCPLRWQRSPILRWVSRAV